MGSVLAEVTSAAVGLTASAALTIETTGRGFIEITQNVRDFLRTANAGEGLLTAFIRHTSASLTIQENADPDVQTDLLASLDRLAPKHAGYVHELEGPDDMPAHIKTMLTAVSLSIPVSQGAPMLGIWQGVYLIEHRDRPHRREVLLQFIGERGRPES